jgi:hypothetical protein
LPQSKDIAQAFLKEAEANLRSARLLLAGEEYSQTIVHCQHAVETKGRVTALLELGASFRPELTRPGEHLTVGTLGRPGRWLCRGDGIQYAHLTQEMMK